MHSFIINFIHFFYAYGWVFIECALLFVLIWLVVMVRKASSYLIYVSFILFLLSAAFIIFNIDYVEEKLGEIIFLLLAVSSIDLFIKEMKK